MLIEFACSNYKSIYKKVKLSMLASLDDTREKELIHFDKYRINRLSAIYGPNGSGKTNILEALAKSRKFIESCLRYELGDYAFFEPHKLAKKDEASKFEFQFVVEDIRYAYGFSVLDGKIDKEYLFYFPNKRQTKIFTREGLVIENGDSFKKFSETAFEVLKENRLFLTCAANYTKNVEIEKAYLFFKEDVRPFWPSNESNNVIPNAIEYFSKHAELKEIYLKIMDNLGTGICDVSTTFDKKKYSEGELPKDMPVRLKEMFMEKEIVRAEAIIQYNEFQLDLETEESTGIKKLFAFMYPFLDSLLNNRVLICDELETGLHESIVAGLLRLFSTLYPDSRAQLIFTTHDTSLLDTAFLRRDQIWFTELDQSRSTDLYSLIEIKNVRKTENLKKGYISGKYGAIPMLNESIFSKNTDTIISSDVDQVNCDD
ncbi:MAG: ATP-binding protein [Bacillota bacterium]|nr:ATP-binding protein [Bacillota bacterium]